MELYITALKHLRTNERNITKITTGALNIKNEPYSKRESVIKYPRPVYGNPPQVTDVGYIYFEETVLAFQIRSYRTIIHIEQ